MMPFVRSLSLLLLLLLPSLALAAQLSLEVQDNQLAVGETVSLQVVVVGAKPRGQPALSAGDGVVVRYQGTSREVQSVNLRTTHITRFQYALTGVSAGRWEVGPATVEADGQELRAEPITVTVGARDASSPAQGDVVATLSDTDLYVGQAAVYRFQYRARGEVFDVRWTPPDYAGFTPSPDAEAVQDNRESLEDGVRVQTQELLIPLVAAQPGSHTIRPAVLAAQVPDPDAASRRRRDPMFDGLFGRSTPAKTETYATEPIDARIRPLPASPPDFSGLVGSFTLSVRPSAEEIRLGDSVTLEVTLSGDGPVAGFRLPLPDDAGFRVYDDAAEYLARVEGGRFAAVATFRRALVPEAEGRIEIPPVEIVAFDPELGEYVTLRSEPVAVAVLPGEAGGGVVTSFAGEPAGGRPVEALGDDILPPPGAARIRDRRLSAALPLLVALPLAPALAWGALAGLTARARRAPDPRRGLRERLAALPAEPAARLSALEQLFREAAALRLGQPAPGLTRGAVAALSPEAEALYADLERARYGGEAPPALEARVRAFVEAA